MEGYRGLILFLLLFITSRDNVDAEMIQTFNVLEGTKLGSLVGTIGSETGEFFTANHNIYLMDGLMNDNFLPSQ